MKPETISSNPVSLSVSVPTAPGSTPPRRTMRRGSGAAVAALAVALLAVSGCATPDSAAQAGAARPISTAELTDASSIPTAGSTAPDETAPSDPGPSDPDRSVISSGEGKASAAPDIISVSLGVETKASSAQKALQDNNSAAAKVIEVLKAQGVAAADLQTTDVQITALTDDRDTSTVTGYQVSNSLTVTLRSLDTAGSILDAVAASAGDSVRIGGLQFGISDDTALLSEARAAAVRQAQTQASEMAAAAGVTLGSVRTISDTRQVTPIVSREYASADAASPTVPLEAGSLTVRVEVEVVYSIVG